MPVRITREPVLSTKTNLKGVPPAGTDVNPQGVSEQEAMHHEIGHLIMADEAGLNPIQIRSRLHPKNQATGSFMDAHIDWSSMGGTEKGIPTAELTEDKVQKALPVFLGGPILQELMGGIKLRDNTEAADDLIRADDWLRAIGKVGESADTMFKVAMNHARSRLDHGPTHDVVRKYADPDASNDPQLQMTPETTARMMNEIRNARKDFK